MSRAGWIGAGLFAIHAGTLFLPPIPPILNGFSVPSYLLGNGAALLMVVAVWRTGVARATAHRETIGTWLWRAVALGSVVGALSAALALRAVWPGLYARWWREEGVFEPLTLFLYAGSAALVWHAADRIPRGSPAAKRSWRLVAAIYLFLALEEVDYFGIFGGLIGRIDGEYAGSLHDVIRLLAVGAVGPGAVVLLAGLGLAAAALLWRAGFLRPLWLVSLAARPEIGWIVLAAIFLGVAAAEEATILGWVATQPTPEEAVELAGGACLALWAVESVARVLRPQR